MEGKLSHLNVNGGEEGGGGDRAKEFEAFSIKGLEAKGKWKIVQFMNQLKNSLCLILHFSTHVSFFFLMG